MITFYYTQYKQNKEQTFESLSVAIEVMNDHFWDGLSCAQVVLDSESKTVYAVTKNGLDSIRREREDETLFEGYTEKVV